MKKTKLSRSSPLKRGTKPLKKVNRKRRQSEFARAYGSKERVAWVKSLGCFVCKGLHVFLGITTTGSCDNAHTETGGLGRKAGYATIVPLCRTHHRCYDQYRKPFNTTESRIAAKSIAVVVEAGWQQHQLEANVASRDSRRQSA